MGVAPTRPGNAAQALEAGPPPLDGEPDDVVPRLSGRRRELDRGPRLSRGETPEGDAEDERVDARVGDDQVGAAAEDTERESARLRPAERREDRRLVVRLDVPARRPADAHRGERRERHALARPDPSVPLPSSTRSRASGVT